MTLSKQVGNAQIFLIQTLNCVFANLSFSSVFSVPLKECRCEKVNFLKIGCQEESKEEEVLPKS